MQDTSIAIVGAGPVGLSLALMLTKLGFKIDIYEKRDFVQAEGHSIALALSARGIHGLETAGVDARKLSTVPLFGRGVHQTNGEYQFQQYGRKDEHLLAVSRDHLHSVMMQEIEKYPSITIHKGVLIEKIDFQSGTVELSQTDSRKYEFVFAADGAFSKVRTQMVKSFIDLQSQMRQSYEYKVHYSGLGYVEVTINSATLDKHCLHYWPRGVFSLFGIPDANKNNQFTGDIFMPIEGGDLCFNNFDKDTFEAFVKATFPGLDLVFHLKCDEQGKLKAHQIPNVLVYPWKLGRCCLVGDAAHGMEPFIGQGLNCGLEDCTVIYKLVKEAQDTGFAVDLVQICDQMQKARKEQVEAIQLMTKANFVETAKHIDDEYFLKRKRVSAYLSENYPDLYVSQYQLVSFNRVDYSKAHQMIPIEAEILAEVSAIEGISGILAKNCRVPLIESILSKYSGRTREIYKGTSADPSLGLGDRQTHFKEHFWTKYNQNSGESVVYLSGHSMGLQPKLTEGRVAEITKQWKVQRDVMALFRNYWFPLEEKLLQQLATVVGAATTEELCLAGSLTANLHLALSTFYRPQEADRRGIMMITPEFSSDVFAVKSWLRLYNIQDGLIEVNVEDTSTANDSIIAEIEKSKGKIQLVCLSAVNYLTGQFYDVRRIAQACREHHIILILQCAHAIGSVALHLHDWRVDCAVWCSYKYLNCCQGTVGGLFIHQDHKAIEPGLKGWHGVDKSEIFNFTPTYKKKPGAQGFQMSCFDPFQYARLAASLDTLALFGGIATAQARNAELYEYVFDKVAEMKLEVISPRLGHGSHVAIKFDRSLKPRLAEFMEDKNIIVDFRDLNEKQFVMRAGFVAMYNDKSDCDAFIQALKQFMIIS